jgi:hypothetical protein
MKFMSRLESVPVHVAMYSAVNEFEECRTQALTLTKRLDYIEGCYKGIASGLKAHGHKPTELMYTDNAQAELAFHERTTQSLQENVSHVVIDPHAHLPELLLPTTYTLRCYDQADLIDAACDSILAAGRDNSSKLIIGFSIKYCVEPDGQGGLVPKSNSIDVIQLASGNIVYVFKVKHIDFFHVK